MKQLANCGAHCGKQEQQNRRNGKNPILTQGHATYGHGADIAQSHGEPQTGSVVTARRHETPYAGRERHEEGLTLFFILIERKIYPPN